MTLIPDNWRGDRRRRRSWLVGGSRWRQAADEPIHEVFVRSQQDRIDRSKSSIADPFSRSTSGYVRVENRSRSLAVKLQKPVNLLLSAVPRSASKSGFLTDVLVRVRPGAPAIQEDRS